MTKEGLISVVLLSVAAVSNASAQDNSPRCSPVPDWHGVWVLEGGEVGISGFGDGSEPPLPLSMFTPGPWNAAGKALIAQALQNESTNIGISWGYPMMMTGLPPIEFITSPCQTIIINSYRDVRHIYTDGRSLPGEDDRWLTVWGESVGRWEGDTLVIETVSVDMPRKRFGLAPPFSDKAIYRERLRRTAPDRIEGTLTVEDPATLESPWTVNVVYHPSSGLERMVHDEFTNDRSELQDGNWVILPPKNEPN